MNLEGKVAIVTGASRGIGRQLALALGSRGARVVVAARTVTPRRTLPGTVGETVAMVGRAGGQAFAVQCDVARREDLERLVAATVAEYGRLDIVVNNAAEMAGDSLATMVDRSSVAATEGPPATADMYDQWAAQFAANVHAPFYMTLLAVPHMRAQGGGAIVNITSGAADLVPVADVAAMSPDQRMAQNSSVAYGPTKAALNRMTNAVAADLAADGITVVAVDPGATRTERAEIMVSRGYFASEHFAPMSLTVDAVMAVLDAVDPLPATGTVIRAQAP